MSKIKTGTDHLSALRDGRTIVIDGETVQNHVDHPAFRAAIRSGAALYDYSALPQNVGKMTFTCSGTQVSRGWQLPTSYEELVERRRAMEGWAEQTCGWIGRTPDHVASTLSAMVMGIELFEKHGRKRAAALHEYFA